MCESPFYFYRLEEGTPPLTTSDWTSRERSERRKREKGLLPVVRLQLSISRRGWKTPYSIATVQHSNSRDSFGCHSESIVYLHSVLRNRGHCKERRIICRLLSFNFAATFLLWFMEVTVCDFSSEVWGVFFFFSNCRLWNKKSGAYFRFMLGTEKKTEKQELENLGRTEMTAIERSKT